jgi:hypothetical protein
MYLRVGHSLSLGQNSTAISNILVSGHSRFKIKHTAVGDATELIDADEASERGRAVLEGIVEVIGGDVIGAEEICGMIWGAKTDKGVPLTNVPDELSVEGKPSVLFVVTIITEEGVTIWVTTEVNKTLFAVPVKVDMIETCEGKTAGTIGGAARLLFADRDDERGPWVPEIIVESFVFTPG